MVAPRLAGENSVVVVADRPDAITLQERIALLRQIPAFAVIPPNSLEDLAVRLREQRFPDETVVVAEGEVADALYVIVEGNAEASTSSPTGPVPLASYQPGEVFGEVALLHLAHRQATVTATGPLLTLRLDKDAFQRLLQEHPEVRTVFCDTSDDMLVVKFLKQASPFAKLTAGEARQLADRLEPLSVSAGTVLMQQGESGDACFLLRSGEVEVLIVEDEAGAERRIAKLGPGSIVGETALLTDAPRDATVRTLEPCDLLVLHRADLLEFTETEQQVGLQMVELVRLRSRPKQAPDIVAQSRVTHDGSVITTLKDTRRVAYYRLSAEGYFVWQRLDGAHTLRDLTLEYLTAFKSFSPQAIAGVVGGLETAGFLQSPSLRKDVSESVNRRSWGQRVLAVAPTILEWRIGLPNIDTPLTRLYRAGVWVLFTRPAQVLLAVLAVGGLLSFALNYGRADSSTPLGGWVLAFFILAYLATILLHELGHAFTVKSFGREVPKGGIGWYWFGPMAFIDTSDMWLADRWPRIAVTLAGPYMSALVAGTASLAASFLGHSVAAAVLWQLAFLSYYLVLRNLDPLMEYDGYYILMDWLDRPNLRDQCLAWLGRDLPAALRNRPQLRRHRMELFYGAAAVVYVFLMGALMLIVYRPILAGWLGAIMPSIVAASIAWLLTGGLVVLSLLSITGGLRSAHRSATS